MNTTVLTPPRPWLLQRSGLDWAFAALVLIGSAFAFWRYGASMDGYEQGILACSVPALILLGWAWAPLRLLTVVVASLSLLALAFYSAQRDGFGADLQAAERVFLLKYLLASQTAVLWSCTLVFLSTLFYWLGLLARSAALESGGTRLAWGAVALALTGTMVRWFESHQIAPDIGHIPVSNLYEVFILFIWLTTLLYLYYEDRYRTRALGAWVMLVVSGATGFLLWYALSRGAHEIQPLVPALQSWWMKIHVPANFVGYGCFALSAMVGLAYLLKTAAPRSLWVGLVLVPGALVAAAAGLRAVRRPGGRQRGRPARLGAQIRRHRALPGAVRGPAQPRHRAPARARAARRVDVPPDRTGFRLLHHRHRAGRLLGRRGLGRLLELGPEGDLGLDRLAELRGLAAHAHDEGPARRPGRLVGADRPAGDHLCLSRRQHVPVGPAQLRRAVRSRRAEPTGVAP
jgi:hypothetical protein